MRGEGEAGWKGWGQGRGEGREGEWGVVWLGVNGSARVLRLHNV